MEKASNNHDNDTAKKVPAISKEVDTDLTFDADTDESFFGAKLESLSDAEFIELSHEIGTDYVGLLSGEVTTDLQKQLAGMISAQLEPLVEKSMDLEGKELARFMIQAYRDSTDKVYIAHDYDAPFAGMEVTEDALAHVTRVVRGPFGIPILYNDGFNEEAFGYDTLSFACTDMMLENDALPLAVVSDVYNPTEKEQVTTHETGHVIFTLLRQAGFIPGPYGEGITIAGKKSAFELARDEAVAQMAANQNSAVHPNVVQRMRQEDYDDAVVSAYLEGTHGYNKRIAEGSGMVFSDAILGVMASRNFQELNDHFMRMSTIANDHKNEQPGATPDKPQVNGGWGSV